MLKGKIIKGIAGFYYVHTAEAGIYACKARGIFRRLGIKPLVGDMVELEVTDEKDKEGNITKVLPRSSCLIRPACANIDQALIIFAAASPDPNLNLLDRFLLLMRQQDLDTIICFNKEDLAGEEQTARLVDIYRDSGYRVLVTSVKEKQGLDQLRALLDGRTTAVAGPSGVGKSSLTNALYPDANMQTGAISEKIGRGRHTTRHAELFYLGSGTYLMDTPGFSTIYLNGFEKEELRFYYPEFTSLAQDCRFQNDCSHISEPDCAVKKALEQGRISRSRYDNYKLFYEEIAGMRKY